MCQNVQADVIYQYAKKFIKLLQILSSVLESHFPNTTHLTITLNFMKIRYYNSYYFIIIS